jgi:diguanylate cyclase (GGDEF)-like protein
VVLCDVDHFKLYNDHYGHLAGDDCLKAVAATIKSVCRRPADLAARFGGEEFVLILPNTPSEGACLVANAMLDAVNALAIPHARSSVATNVTLSAGIAAFDSQRGVNPAELIARADGALYQAKERGRNCCVLPEYALEGGHHRTEVAAVTAPILLTPEPGLTLLH